MRTAVIIFSGYNQRAVVAFIRTLVDQSVRFAIIASSDKDPILSSDYSKYVMFTRSKKALSIAECKDAINTCKNRLFVNEFIIAPSTEALNRFVLNHREQFRVLGCEIPLVEKNLYEEISDKRTFGGVCEDNGIVIPQEFHSFEEAPVPCVAKPIRYVAANGHTYSPVLIFTQQDKDDFASKYTSSDFYYQEYVSGQSYYLLYYFYSDGRVQSTSQINIVQQPFGKSIVAAQIAEIHKDVRAEKYVQLLKKINYKGLIMVEVKDYNNELVMIEANPRFWGPSQLFVDSGVNLFLGMLVDAGLLKENKNKDEDEGVSKTKYYWHGGIVETVNSGNRLVYHGIEKTNFLNNLDEWFRVDVYNRKDTKQLFIDEAGDYDTTAKISAALLKEQ